MLGSLRFRLSLIFIGLAVIPTILVSAIFGFRAFATLEEQSLAMQRKVADRVSGELGAFIRVYEHEMNTLDSVYELGTANPGTQRAILDTLLEHERTYQEIALIDVAGREQYRTSRFDISTENAPTDWLERDEFQVPLAKRETFDGEVR